MNPIEPVRRALRHFVQDTRAVISAELVLILPVLCWAYFATMIFNDAYRAKMQAQAAALHVADAISRTTTMVTEDYLEGMNDLYDFLAGSQTTRLRITSVIWDDDTDLPRVLWSYGTRGMNALPQDAFQLLGQDELGALRVAMDGADGDDLVAGFTQMPVTNLHQRIPPVMPGEALILVESFTMWQTPVNGLFLGFDMLEDMRLSPIAVVRPRFGPFINFEGAQDVAPPDASEYVSGGAGTTTSDPGADDPAPGDTDPSSGVDVAGSTFDTDVADGWSDGDTDSRSDGSGNGFLGRFGGSTSDSPVRYDVDLGAPSTSARITFDLLVIDSWDGYNMQYAVPEGDLFTLGVGDSAVATEAFHHELGALMRADRLTRARLAEGDVTTRMTLVESGRDFAGTPRWDDQLWRVTVDIADPQQTFALEFSANIGQSLGDESFGIDDFSVSAVRGQPDPTHFIPNAQDRRGADPKTRFARYDGCPEPRMAAQTHVVTLSDLEAAGGALRYAVEAGGQQALPRCAGFRGNEEGFVNANPTLVLDWDGEGRSGPGTDLVIRTDDGNSGFTCDAVLAIRDPNGQMVHNGWINWGGRGPDDWNARWNFGPAQDGTYQVWVGQWNRGTCDTDIEIGLQ